LQDEFNKYQELVEAEVPPPSSMDLSDDDDAPYAFTPPFFTLKRNSADVKSEIDRYHQDALPLADGQTPLEWWKVNCIGFRFQETSLRYS
jgi:hypothetical protein